MQEKKTLHKIFNFFPVRRLYVLPLGVVIPAHASLACSVYQLEVILSVVTAV